MQFNFSADVLFTFQISYFQVKVVRVHPRTTSSLSLICEYYCWYATGRNRENDYISRTKKISIFIWKKVNSSQLCVLFIPVRIHAGCWENARKVCKTTSLRQVTYEVSLSKFSNLKERPCSHLITDIKSRKRKVKKPRQCFDNSQKLMPQHNHSKTKNQTKKCNDTFNPNDFFLSGW